MSQLFHIRITAFGSADAIDGLIKFISNDWAEMARGNGILNGFSYVPKKMPLAKVNAVGGGVRVVFDFRADGRSPFVYAIALSQKFPSLRIALMTADASSHEWLALVIAAFKGAFACAQFRRGEEGCPSGFNDATLLTFLHLQAPELGRLISEDGQILVQSGPLKFNDVEMGVSV